MRESTTHSTDIWQVAIYRCSKYHGPWMTPECVPQPSRSVCVLGGPSEAHRHHQRVHSEMLSCSIRILWDSGSKG